MRTRRVGAAVAGVVGVAVLGVGTSSGVLSAASDAPSLFSAVVTGIGCLTGVWDYASFVSPTGSPDLTFTGVTAEFGPGYFRVDGADGTATGTLAGYQKWGTVISTSLVASGSMSALEDGTVRLGIDTNDSSASVDGVAYPTASAALVPDTPLVPACDGDIATMTTRSGGVLTFSRRSDAPSPPAPLPTVAGRDPAGDCLEGQWAVPNVSNTTVAGAETSIDYTDMALTFADGLVRFDFGSALSGTLEGATVTADLGGGIESFYSTADVTLAVDEIFGNFGGPFHIVVNGSPVDPAGPVDLPGIVPVLRSMTIDCDGDAATLSSTDGSVLSLQRIARPGESFVFPYEDYFEVPQLGSEPVEGTGCGGDGSIGETIPDGLWRGEITSFDGSVVSQSTSLEFDLVCVYIGDVAQQLWAGFNAENPEYGSPPWDGEHFTVNNNPRTRTVTLAPGFTVRRAEFLPDGPPTSDGFQGGTCGVSGFEAPLEHPELAYFNDEWLQIENGAAVWAVVSCPHD